MFIRGEPVGRPPRHPILMRFAAQYAGVSYGDFCLNPECKADAMSRCADDFELDWVTVMSDPFAEAEAYGLHVEYPENDLPKDNGHVLTEDSDPDLLPVLQVEEHRRLRNLVRTVELLQERYGDGMFKVGWVEGPFAEYADLRGLTGACMDLYDDAEKVRAFAERITENALRIAEAQVKAGADCIGIGDAVCSQIGAEMYRDLFQPLEKRMVDRIHQLGAMVKLHICGNTSHILPDMIVTGSDIVDVDHLVGSMRPFAPLLSRQQVFSGNVDPVSVVQDGSPDEIRAAVFQCLEETDGRCILSAGCEITPGTPIENMKALCVG